MESRGNNSHNKCILPRFILYSQLLSTNLYINALEYQCITFYCSLERKEFLGSEKEMIQGLVKKKERLCTHGATLSHCTNTGRASTFPSSYCPSKTEQQKKNISATYCAVWPWATYFTSYKKCLFLRRLWGWNKLANESCCCMVGHSTSLVLNTWALFLIMTPHPDFCILWHSYDVALAMLRCVLGWEIKGMAILSPAHHCESFSFWVWNPVLWCIPFLTFIYSWYNCELGKKNLYHSISG